MNEHERDRQQRIRERAYQLWYDAGRPWGHDYGKKAAEEVDRDLNPRIEKRAYKIWEQEGHPEGRWEEHWNKAAHEIAMEDRPLRERAYRIWERENRPEGRWNEHWKKAMQEIAEERDQQLATRRSPPEIAQPDEQTKSIEAENVDAFPTAPRQTRKLA